MTQQSKRKGKYIAPTLEIAGWIKFDPQYSEMPSGDKCTEFVIDYNYGTKAKGKVASKRFQFKAFGELALLIYERYRKGDIIHITKTRYLHLRDWKDKIWETWVVDEIELPDEDAALYGLAPGHDDEQPPFDDDIPY